jgi:replicative DNA helicase
LWDTDGSSEGYGTVSFRLAKDVQRLLLYFGIITQLHRKKTKWQNGEGYSWRLRLTRPQSIILFWDEVGKFLLSPLKKAQLSNKYCKCRASDSLSSNILNFPKETWGIIGGYVDLRILLKEMLDRANGNLKRATSQGISHSRLEKIIKLIESRGINPITLKTLINANVYWAEIDNIESVGSDLTYDLEIEDNHSFVAESFVTHNSAGKSNLIKAQANLGFRIASVATEQTEEVETDRIDSLNTGIPLKEISNSKDWPNEDKRFKQIIDSNKFIDKNWKYFLNVRRNISTEGVAAWLRSVINKHGELDVCYIDLFDKLTDLNVQEKNDALISSKLGYLNQVAEELNVHICLIVQIHRAAVKDVRSDHRPKMHNLKSSGSFEEVARLILLLHREKYYNSKIVEDVIEFNVAKQNNGPAGDNITANLLFEKETLTIRERPESVPNIY